MMPDHPPAHVGLGRPREPRAKATAPSGALASIWAAIAGRESTKTETDDRLKANRGLRIAQLKELHAPPDIWLDLQEILTEAFDTTLKAVIGKELDPDALLATTNILALFDKDLAQGRAAMERLAMRHVRSAAAAHGAAPAGTMSTTEGAM